VQPEFKHHRTYGTVRSEDFLIASDTSIEAALEPVKLFQCIGESCRDIGGGSAVQRLCLDQPGASGRIIIGSLGLLTAPGKINSSNLQPLTLTRDGSDAG
jgi:hypothetical protein